MLGLSFDRRKELNWHVRQAQGQNPFSINEKRIVAHSAQLTGYLREQYEAGANCAAGTRILSKWLGTRCYEVVQLRHS